MAEPSDRELVEQVRAGDNEAFGELLERHQRAMLAVARCYFASEADIDDAVQEALLRAFRNLDQLSNPSSFKSWLTRITRRVCIDTLRSRTDKLSLSDFASTARLRPRLGQTQFTPATLTRKGEVVELVRVAIGHLPEGLRVVIMLQYSERMTYDQIAEYVGVPATTVQGRLRRAKRALGAVLKALAAT